MKNRQSVEFDKFHVLSSLNLESDFWNAICRCVWMCASLTQMVGQILFIVNIYELSIICWCPMIEKCTLDHPQFTTQSFRFQILLVSL
jgi:hypothetical protein